MGAQTQGTEDSMNITTAKGCAWRAFYVARDLPDGYGRHQFFHLGVDPNNGVRPVCFGAIGNPWKRRGFRICWRFPLPWVRWRPVQDQRFRALWLAEYRLAKWFWLRVDGRRFNRSRA